MVKETTYTGKFGSWQRLLTTLVANISVLGHMEAPRAKLEALLARGLEIAKQQAALAASKQELSKELQGVVVDGERTATALRVLLKEHFGPRSEKLAEFGIQPFRGRARKEKPLPPPEEVKPRS
ncbi:MAG TPA: hypothetical protein VMW27_23770 [Thermoanaerobaculia bacterium]|nr:hypothetical protein [Thermoanaerobaculia bacterium]